MDFGSQKSVNNFVHFSVAFIYVIMCMPAYAFVDPNLIQIQFTLGSYKVGSYNMWTITASQR